MSSYSANVGYSSAMRYALSVALICYAPYIFIAPWWLLLFIVSTMGYCWFNDYYGRIKPLPKSLRFALCLGCLLLLRAHYGSISSSPLYIGFLQAFIGLKILESHNKRDLKVLALSYFYLIFSALIVVHELWIIVYLLCAIIANISLMLKLSAPEASLKHIGGVSCKQFFVAIPLAILLFYIFPRIEYPLWQVPSQQQEHLGFSEQMTPGSIAQLFHDERTAFRVTFRKGSLLNAYWQGLVLNFYNGTTWSSVGQKSSDFHSLPPFQNNVHADYEVLLEPSQQKWLFYTKEPTASTPKLLFNPIYGLMSVDSKNATQRFSYALSVHAEPYRPLDKDQWNRSLELPLKSNPQLRAWATQHYAAVGKNPHAFILFLQNHIQNHAYWYSLSPPGLPIKNQMDAFWFDTRKGFCEHYASAVTFILRSVGIPAHVVVGYHGGTWNPYARYLNVQQRDAHAWLEYWQEGVGWSRFDPTAAIARFRIEQVILDQQQEYLKEYGEGTVAQLSWLERSRLLWASAWFFAERWLLFYDQDTQNSLLALLGLGHWGMEQLTQAVIACLLVFLIVLGLFYHWRQKHAVDPLVAAYHLLQKEFRRFNVLVEPSSTLKQQCDALKHKKPELNDILTEFISCYERLRLQQESYLIRNNKREIIKLLRSLRKTLHAQPLVKRK